MIWHLLIKPLYNLVWGNAHAERRYWRDIERTWRWESEYLDDDR